MNAWPLRASIDFGLLVVSNSCFVSVSFDIILLSCWHIFTPERDVWSPAGRMSSLQSVVDESSLSLCLCLRLGLVYVLLQVNHFPGNPFIRMHRQIQRRIHLFILSKNIKHKTLLQEPNYDFGDMLRNTCVHSMVNVVQEVRMLQFWLWLWSADLQASSSVAFLV